MKIGRAAVAVVAAVATVLVGAPSADAEPGDPDSTFGRCGIRMFSPPVAPPAGLHSTLVQADGKILQVGQGDDRSVHVSRLVPSGAGVDRAYGTDGIARVANPGSSFIRAATVGPNDSVVVAAERVNPTPQHGTRLFRITASGRPDHSFGSGGVVTSDAVPPAGVLVQANNRIITWGGAIEPNLTRYRADGTVDSAWSPQLPTSDYGVSAATLAASGNLIVATGVDPTRLYRFKPSGTADATFSASFVFPGTNLAANSGFQPSTIVELSDGKLLVVGVLLIWESLTTHTFIGSTRLTATGQVDTTYGAAGFATIPVPWSPFTPVARIDAQGRLLVAGTFGHDPAFSSTVLVRFTAAGDPDTTFGNAGVAALDIGDWARVSGLVLRGKWIIVGNAFGNRNETAAVVRFRTDSTTLGAGYWFDSDGGLLPFRFGFDSPPPCVLDGPSLAGLARGITTVTNRGGYVLDGFGGLHRFSAGVRKAPAIPKGAPYWPGWDIARGVAALVNGKGGYVVDGFGGIHRYRTGSNPLPPPTSGGPYWSGWDIARGIALLPDGTGGYVVDGFGGIHPFAVGGNPMPPPTSGVMTPVADFFRSIAILPDASGGYVTSQGGGITTFAIGSHPHPETPCPCGPFPQPGQHSRLRGVTLVAPRAGAG